MEETPDSWRDATSPVAGDDSVVSPTCLSLLRTVIDDQADAISVTDRELRFIAVNKAWSAMIGLSEAEAIGRTPRELLGDLGVPAEQEMTKVLSGRELIRTFAAEENGQATHATLTPWRDADGQVCGVLSRNAVEPDARLTERRERRLSLALKMARAYGFEIDFRSGEINYEPARPTNVEGPPIHSFDDMLAIQPEASRPETHAAWEHHLATGEMLVLEYPRLLRDGQVQWQMSAFEAVRDMSGEVVGVVGMTQVIDDRKRAEIALTAEKEAAQAADRAKSEFLANMSHEIRTPLNGVLGLSSLLRQTELTAAQSEMVRTIETSALTLNVLLSDLLDLAKIESGRLELDPQPFDPVELVGHIHKLFAGAAAEKRLSFTCEVDPSLHGLVIGDRTRLSQILTNLTSNAIKFTGAGAVTIRAWAEGEGAERRATFTVTDTGVGISDAVVGQLFERFVQADGSTNRLFGGTGLGLAISRTLARLMGGDVQVASQQGSGSTFNLTVKAPRWFGSLDEPPEEMAADETLSADRATRVLLVEDHPVNRRVVELILGEVVSLECVENGVLGVAAFKEQPFDVVLMDMQMPVMDGLEATREIRAFERASGRAPVPIVMLSANALDEHVKQGLEAGATFHLAKPVAADQLVKAVARAAEIGARAEAANAPPRRARRATSGVRS